MGEFAQRPLFLRIIRSRVFWALLFMTAIIVVVGFSQVQLGGRLTDAQAQFVEDSVRRSAIECYAIEGRFPDTLEGVRYLEDNYGLAIDHKRYGVYYESLGDNLVPEIQVIPIPQTSTLEDIAFFLGITGEGG